MPKRSSCREGEKGSGKAAAGRQRLATKPLLARKRNPLPRRRSNPVLRAAVIVETNARADQMDTLYLVVVWETPVRNTPKPGTMPGFMAVERFVERSFLRSGRTRRSSKRAWRERRSVSRKVILCEPQTFMNSSGEAVGRAGGILSGCRRSGSWWWWMMRICRLGRFGCAASGSSGGHHGLESIEQHLGTREYARLRIGIGRTDARARDYGLCAGPVQCGRKRGAGESFGAVPRPDGMLVEQPAFRKR